MPQKQDNRRDKQDIQFRRSLFRFTCAFVFVLLCGLITRVLVAQIPLSEKLNQALDKSEIQNITFYKPAIVFSWGWMPAIALELNRVDWQNQNCASQKVSVQNALVVLDIGQLVLGEFIPGTVNIEFVDGVYSSRCDSFVGPVNENPQIKAANPESKPKQTLKVSKHQEKFKEVFEKSLPKLSNLKLNRLIVDKFRFHLMQDITNEYTVEGSGVFKINKELDADLNFYNFFYKKQKLDFLDLNLNLLANSEKIELNLETEVREGLVVFNSQIENKESYPFSIDLNISKMPISPLAQLFSQEVPLKYLWLTCQLGLKSNFNKISEDKFKTDKCQLNGPYGEAIVSNVDMTAEKLNAFEVEFNKLQLDKIFKEKRDVYFSGVFANYGNLSAKYSYKQNSYKLDGILNNSEFIFSNNNLRKIQKVNSLPFSFEGDKQSWKVSLSKIQLDQGQFIGDLVVQKAKKSDVAFGKVSFHKLRFNPQIYKLILNSKPSDVRLYGKFQWQDNKISQWSAVLATPELNSEVYQFKNLKVKGQSGPEGQADLKISVAEGLLKDQSLLVNWVKPTQLDKNWGSEPVSFNELSTYLSIFKDRSVSWRRGYLKLKNKWQLSSEGSRTSDKKVVAWLQWDRPDGKFLNWDYQGQFFEGEWKPRTPWVQNWLTAHQDFLNTNRSIKFEVAKNDQKNIKKQLNDVGKKAIETVKEVLKPKGN